MADAHANFAYSLVATAPSPASSGTSLVVTAADGAKFPAVPFNATIWPAGAQPTAANAEIVRVTARSTDTLTITRAQESSSARTVVIGDQIAATVTAKTLTDVEAGLGYGASVFGDGSDGSVTFDGSTTILGMVPAASVYSLTRDFFFSAVTLNSGVQIKTNGFRLFCSGTFTGVDATSIIQWNGNAAAATVAGAALINTNSSILPAAAGATSPGTAGGNGGTTVGTGATAGTQPSLGGAGGVGGTGNAGGNAGGAGATVTALTTKQATPRANPLVVLLQTVGVAAGGDTWFPIAGGGGGGGGGGDGTAGGGGGSGGGMVVVCAKAFAGTGAIQARGGKGGNPAGGNRGAGGGGGGGVVVVLSQSVVAGAVAGWTIDANAGGAGTSTGNGGLPGGGSNGTTILLPA